MKFLSERVMLINSEDKRLLRKSLSIAAAVIFLLGFIKYRQISAAIAEHASFSPPPETVTSVVVKGEEWQSQTDVVGSLSAVQGVTISAELAGKVVKIGFESGSDVKQGDLLVQLDDSVEQADLQSAQAMSDLSAINLKRVQSLHAKEAMSEQSLNNAVAEERNARAKADAVRALIGKKTILAPFDGRTGIRMVNVGQYVKEGDPLVPLNSINQLFLNFSLPENKISQVSVGQKLSFSVDALPGTDFEANLSAIDSQVDPATRNVKLQAVVQNEKHQLTPGMFAHVKFPLFQKVNVFAVPATAINYAPYGNSVYVIDKLKDPKGNEYTGVRQQFVHLGETRGDLVAILTGLKSGEEVVTSGVFKLRPGAGVVVNNSVVPSGNAAPKPADT